MRGQHNRARLCSLVAHDKVAQRHRPDWRVGGEGVLFALVAQKVRAQKFFGLQVSRPGRPARTDGRKFACVFVSLGAVESLP
jgi:hypothetical protein